MASQPPFLPPPPQGQDFSGQPGFQAPQGGSPPDGMPSQEGLTPPPDSGGQSFLQKIAPFLPMLAGTAMAGLAHNGSGLQAFGAGLGEGSGQSLLDQNLQKQKLQMEQDHNVVKNLDSQIAKLRDRGGLGNPQITQAINMYDQGMASGKPFTGKDAARIHQMLLGSGNLDQMMGDYDTQKQIQQHQAFALANANAERMAQIQGRAEELGGSGLQPPPGMNPHDWAAAQQALADEATQARAAKMAAMPSTSPGDNYGLTPAEAIKNKHEADALRHQMIAEDNARRQTDIMEQYRKFQESGGAEGQKLSVAEKTMMDTIDSAAPLLQEMVTNLAPGVDPKNMGDEKTYQSQLAKTRGVSNSFWDAASGWFQEIKGKAGMAYAPGWDQLVPILEHLRVLSTSPYLHGSRNMKLIEQIQSFIPAPHDTPELKVQKALGMLHTFQMIKANTGQTTHPLATGNSAGGGLPAPPGGGAAPTKTFDIESFLAENGIH